MQHRYFVQGVTCDGCRKSLLTAWLAVDGIQDVQFSTDKDVYITMGAHISLEVLQSAIKHLQKYRVSDTPFSLLPSWMITYRPLFLILGIVVFATLLHTWFFSLAGWHIMMAFMGWWFVIFSMLKLFNLPGFVSGYQNYDIIASRRSIYAWIYPFMELALGIFFLIGFAPLLASIVTLIVMLIGTIGVRKALGKKIQCVCIGTWFSLPLTKVTIVENLVMAVMALVMVIINTL